MKKGKVEEAVERGQWKRMGEGAREGDTGVTMLRGGAGDEREKGEITP